MYYATVKIYWYCTNLNLCNHTPSIKGTTLEGLINMSRTHPFSFYGNFIFLFSFLSLVATLSKQQKEPHLMTFNLLIAQCQLNISWEVGKFEQDVDTGWYNFNKIRYNIWKMNLSKIFHCIFNPENVPPGAWLIKIFPCKNPYSLPEFSLLIGWQLRRESMRNHVGKSLLTI